ncbi:HD family phosphohydrolase [Aerococcaceae bacterium WGS1372]
MNQQLRKLQTTLGDFYIPLVLLLMSVFIFIIGYSDVQPNTYNFQINQVAEETIQAPVTVEDAEQTEINKERARSSVSDVYAFQPSIAQEQMDLVNQFFAILKELRETEYSTNDIKTMLENNYFDNTIDINTSETNRTDTQSVPFGQLNTAEQLVVYYDSMYAQTNEIIELSQSLSNNSVVALITTSDANLNEYRNQLIEISQTILSREILSPELNQAVSAAIERVNDIGINGTRRTILTEMLQEIIIPTSIYSESETEKRKEEAANAIQPSYILQGQIIAQKGHIIDQNTYRQLDLLGYLNRQTNNDLLIIFAIIVIIHGILLFYQMIKDNPKNGELNDRARDVTAYSILFVTGFLLTKVLHLVQINGIDYALLLLPVYSMVKLLISRTNYRLTVFFITSFNFMNLFIIHDGDSLTVTFITILFYIFSSILAVLYPLYINNTSLRLELTIASITQLIFVVPIILMTNVSLTSDPSIIIIVFTLLNALVSIGLYFFLEPYWHKLLSSKAPLTLNQLANLNHPLLKEIVEKSPGTYHHSMMVANIASAAASKIGADSDFVRIASYYHDVGKTLHPLFFVENLSDGMESPHTMISAEESATIIIEHVTEGEKLLRQNNMPESIINICLQHHGTTLVKYFYAQAKESNPKVETDLFRYPGPKPQNKEAMIIMLADSIEAASRTVKEHSQSAFEQLVDRIIEGKLEEGQFDESNMTVSELNIVRKALVHSVASMYHTRVDYPD